MRNARPSAIPPTFRVRLYGAVLVLATALFAGACGESRSLGAPAGDPPYFGSWSGTDGLGQTIVLRFHEREDGATSLYLTLGSDGNEKRAYGYCKVDLSRSPASFDIHLDDRDTITTILELVDDETLQFENIEPGDPRPTQFGSARVVLTKVR